MVVLRLLLSLCLLLGWSFPASAHMGRTITFLCPTGTLNEVAANMTAAYMGEQMARNVKVVAHDGTIRCLDGIRDHEAPMALVPEDRWTGDDEALVRVGDSLQVAGTVFVLVMGREAAGQLQFSLVPQYLLRLENVLSGIDISNGLEKAGNGEGARKIALDLLREADLL